MPAPGQKSKFTYQFDGLDFVPYSSEIPAQYAPQILVAWQNSEGLSENLDTGNVYIYDLGFSVEKPKFSVQCSKAQEINIRSSPTGYAILVWSQNFTDSSGKSYYGEHSLQYVQLQGKVRLFIPVFNGMIHDVKWSAAGDYFIVISGT